jgi:hypothetical protein
VGFEAAVRFVFSLFVVAGRFGNRGSFLWLFLCCYRLFSTS